MKTNLREIFNELVSLHNEGRHQAMSDFLKSMGAEFVAEGAFSKCFGLKCEWGSVAIKFGVSGYPVNLLDEGDKQLFPLLWRRYVKPLFASEYVVIQPMAENLNSTSDRKKFYRAARILCNWFDKLYENDFDAHHGNVGFYRGKMMIFDPLTPDRRDAARGLLYGYSSNGSDESRQNFTREASFVG